MLLKIVAVLKKKDLQRLPLNKFAIFVCLQEAEDDEVVRTFKRRKAGEKKDGGAGKAPLGAVDGFKPLD